MADDISAGNVNEQSGVLRSESGHGTNTALPISPENHTMLLQWIRNIQSEIEKEKDKVHGRERNALEERINKFQKQNEDGRQRADGLQKKLLERDTQLQMAISQLGRNAAEMEALQARVSELQRSNTDLLTRNRQLEVFQSNIEQVVNRNMLPVQPTVAVQALDIGENSRAGGHDVVAIPSVTLLAEKSVPVMTERAAPVPTTEHSCSSQSSVDNMSPELPALAALLPESPLPTPLDISFDSSTSDRVVDQKTPAASEPNSTDFGMATVNHDLAAEASSEIIQPESPEVARPKKKVTFSPHSPEVHIIQPIPVVTGKRKRMEPLVMAHVCKACRVEYESQAELSGHWCSSPVYECSLAGCGRTFNRKSSKRRHEMAHAEMVTTSGQRTSSRVTGHSPFQQ